MTDLSQMQPHPLIVDPVLYITGIPPTVSDTEIAQAFEACLPVRPTIMRDGMGAEGGGYGRIEFKYLASGE